MVAIMAYFLDFFGLIFKIFGKVPCKEGVSIMKRHNGFFILLELKSIVR